MVSIFQRGLFWRVYLTLLGSLVLVAVLSALVWHSLAEQPMRGAMSYPGAALGALLPPPTAPRADTDEALARVSSATDGLVLLLAADGRPVGAALHGRPLPPPTASQAGRRGPRHTHRWRVHLTDGRTLVIAEPSRSSGDGPHILGMLMAVAAAVGLGAYPLVSRLTHRLEKLRTGLDAWGAGRLDARATVEGGDEIAAVAASFNTAADRVEALLAAHKALLAHASHELRSPLTRLRVAVELFAAQPEAGLRASILTDIAELDSLVEEILLASRLDHAPGEVEQENVDLLGLAAEEAARAGADLKAPEDASAFEVQGSARLLRRMIRNLIENAGKHGQPPVEVELGRSGDRITLGVHDHGAGIPEAEWERVFEPFYRPSGRAEAAGSWGLGLSIVRQIAQRHGGTVICRSRPEGGGSFIATLPAHPRAA
jgi:signal transduction histidine kinase